MYPFQPVERLIQIDSLITVYNFARPKGFYFQGESHDFWECVYIHEGEATATADERVYQLGAGKLLLHKPMEFHRIWSSDDCAPWLVNISFQAHGALTEKLACRCFDLRPEQQERLWEIVKTFTQLKNCKDSQYSSFANLTAALLEAFLIDLTHSEEYSAPSQAPNDERYSKIVQIMKTNCHRNLSLAELAQLCQMSVSNMKRVFHLYSDVGIAKYFLTLRMRYAMELLEGGTPGNQVAEMLNFPDTAYFYTVFKRETGMTPAQYRRQKLQA
ncbi:MAG: helix-turn-helix transcriptional regulator [Oscillospiraceae bacterium]|nr:helix-turn-helix transcriptional regulator [Oscillospiraceae bacterium]